jgi:hypothetical protein
MFTLTKIYAQANSRNVNIATSGVVKPGNIRANACLPDNNFTAQQDDFSGMRYQAVIDDGCRMWNMVEQRSTMSRVSLIDSVYQYSCQKFDIQQMQKQYEYIYKTGKKYGCCYREK